MTFYNMARQPILFVSVRNPLSLYHERDGRLGRNGMRGNFMIPQGVPLVAPCFGSRITIIPFFCFFG